MKLLLSILCLLFFGSISGEAHDQKTVLVAILARNKSHTLPRYLKCIENLDYDKKAITIYINTNNNEDRTEEILKEWIQKHRQEYRQIIFESHHAENLSKDKTHPHEWTIQRFKTLGEIRNKSMRKTLECGCDYYFVIDCDNFVTPATLKTLVGKDKPIIAPMLPSIPEKNDPYSNFFFDITDDGYWKDHPNFWKILFKMERGTFKVPVVHCTYLIKAQWIDQLTYQDGTTDFEFVIFSRSARKNNVEQYICNEENFGVLLHFLDDFDLQGEKKRVEKILCMP